MAWKCIDGGKGVAWGWFSEKGELSDTEIAKLEPSEEVEYEPQE